MFISDDDNKAGLLTAQTLQLAQDRERSGKYWAAAQHRLTQAMQFTLSFRNALFTWNDAR